MKVRSNYTPYTAADFANIDPDKANREIARAVKLALDVKSTIKRVAMKKIPTKTQLTRRATATAQRKAVIEAGGKSLYVLLDAKHAKLFARAVKKSGLTAKELIQEFIARNA